VQDQHFMLQKEVVDRMVAVPGDVRLRPAVVMLQWRYAMEDVLFVPPESFDPPPRVDSAVVRMVPLRNPPPVDARALSEMVQVAFSQRRKILRQHAGQVAGGEGLRRRASTCSAGRGSAGGRVPRAGASRALRLERHEKAPPTGLFHVRGKRTLRRPPASTLR
jgi:16S rRNA A1518/A1519 N6-dimethyltransferase RsmA/KsgA/DIM1 with predicted DNA glycosylase/AP lyase activity